MFRKIIIIFLAILLFGGLTTSEAFAKKKKQSKGGLSSEKVEQITNDIKHLTKKIYASSLFSPEENEKLIAIKIELDTGMINGPSPEFAPLYFMAGNLYRDREYVRESIECYQTILENFSETAFGPKARRELQKMGIKVETPQGDSEEDDSEGH